MGCTAYQKRHRRGRALVNVGQPHVKRHGAQFEGQPCNDKHQAKHQHLVIDLSAGNGVEHFIELQRPGRTVQHGQAVKQEARSQRPQHKVLHGRLCRGRIVTAQGHQRVARQRQQLQAHIEHQEVVPGDHHKHAKQGKQAEREVFATAQHAAIKGVRPAIDQRDHQRDAGKTLEPIAHGVADHHVAKTVDGLAAQRINRFDDRHHAQRQQGQGIGAGAALRFHAKVGQQNNAGHGGENDVGENRDPTEFVNHLNSLDRLLSSVSGSPRA